MSDEGECVDAGKQCLLLSFLGGPEAGSEGHKTALSPNTRHVLFCLICMMGGCFCVYITGVLFCVCVCLCACAYECMPCTSVHADVLQN